MRSLGVRCKAPYEGVKDLTAGVFIDSLSRSLLPTAKNVNKVKCEGCSEENATMHCADCGQNMGPSCLAVHGKLKVSAAHQLIPVHDVLKGQVEVTRIPRCQTHIGSEINTYCKTCNDAVCLLCLSERHSGHTFCPLSQVTGPLQDQIAGYTITNTKREEEARKAVATLDGTINKIEEHRIAAEKEIATFSSTLHAAVDARVAVLVSEMQDQGDQLRKTAIQEKGEAESATVEFREFHFFTEGLLAQGTPLEIAGTHKMVRISFVCLRGGVVHLFFSLLVFIVVQVQARNETLEKLPCPTNDSLVSPVFKFSANVDEVKKAISTMGSIVTE